MTDHLTVPDYPTYQISDFRKNSDKHLAVIISKGWMQPNNYRVYKAFYLQDHHGTKYFFDVGFVSDGGSFPIWLSPFLRYNGKGMAGFLIHDLECNRANDSGLYAYRAIGDSNLSGHLLECDVYEFAAKGAGSAVKRFGEHLKRTGKLK
jgi:hypothetical protein